MEIELRIYRIMHILKLIRFMKLFLILGAKIKFKQMRVQSATSILMLIGSLFHRCEAGRIKWNRRQHHRMLVKHSSCLSEPTYTLYLTSDHLTSRLLFNPPLETVADSSHGLAFAQDNLEFDLGIIYGFTATSSCCYSLLSYYICCFSTVHNVFDFKSC